MSAAITLDYRQFQSALTEYVKYSKRDIADILNQKAASVLLNAASAAPTGNKASILALHGNKDKRIAKVWCAFITTLIGGAGYTIKRRVKATGDAAKAAWRDTVTGEWRQGRSRMSVFEKVQGRVRKEWRRVGGRGFVTRQEWERVALAGGRISAGTSLGNVTAKKAVQVSKSVTRRRSNAVHYMSSLFLNVAARFSTRVRRTGLRMKDWNPDYKLANMADLAATFTVPVTSPRPSSWRFKGKKLSAGQDLGWKLATATKCLQHGLNFETASTMRHVERKLAERGRQFSAAA